MLGVVLKARRATIGIGRFNEVVVGVVAVLDAVAVGGGVLDDVFAGVALEPFG